MGPRTFVLLLILLALGCSPQKQAIRKVDGGTKSSAPLPRVDAISLQAMPTAVNWDDQPGPDGLQIRLHLFQQTQPMPVVLERGQLEAVIYEGRVKAKQLSAAKPFYKWDYSAGALNRVKSKSIVGWGYRLSLGWNENVPKTDTITLSVRLMNPNGAPLYAKPIYLAMGPK